MTNESHEYGRIWSEGLWRVTILVPQRKFEALMSAIAHSPFFGELDIHQIHILPPKRSKEAVHILQKEFLSEALAHLNGLLSDYQQNLYHVERQIARHGGAPSSPVHLVHPQKKLMADVTEIERRISELTGSPEEIC